MHVEDYVMLHEGAILWYIVVGYIAIEASVLFLLSFFIYIKKRMQVDSLSWDISSCFLEVKPAEWYKKKFEDLRNPKQTDDEEKMNDE